MALRSTHRIGPSKPLTFGPLTSTKPTGQYSQSSAFPSAPSPSQILFAKCAPPPPLRLRPQLLIHKRTDAQSSPRSLRARSPSAHLFRVALLRQQSPARARQLFRPPLATRQLLPEPYPNSARHDWKP